MRPDISTSLAGIKLASCIFNASGPKDETLSQLCTLGKSQTSAIVMKSCTLEPRAGNPEPRYSALPHKSSINSMGLPNLGYKKYVKFVGLLKKKYPKPVIASISGMSLKDNVVMFKAFNATDVDSIEFNPGSPNTIGKPIVGYDMEAMDRLLDKLAPLSQKPMGVKLPPYFDFIHFEQIAAVLKKYPIKYITTINSIGNGLVIDPETERTVIKPKGGFGGIGGKLIKYTALGNVRKLYELLGKNIQVVGVGGITNGTDVFEYILAGATAVQVGTLYHQEGPKCFIRLQKELKTLMRRKGYQTLADFRGKLKPL